MESITLRRYRGNSLHRRRKRVRYVNINISQVDSRVLVTVDGKALPDIFSRYELKSSGCGEMELWLSVKGIVHVSALAAKIEE